MAKREVGSNGSHRRRSYTPEKDRSFRHFLKIILPDTMEEMKLRIPDKFVEKYGNELSDVINLIVPNGCGWRVGLTRSVNSVWLDEYWQEFVEHHSIHPGYYLVFSYRGFSHFNIIIFDTTLFEVEYPCNDEQRIGGGPNYVEKLTVDSGDEKEDDGSHTGMVDSTIPSSPNCSSLKARGKRNTTSEHNLGKNKRHRNAGFVDKRNLECLCLNNIKREKGISEEQINQTDYDANESRTRKLVKQEMLSTHETLTKTIEDNCKSKTKLDENESPPQCEEDAEVTTGEMFTAGFNKVPQESMRAIHAARKLKPKNPSFMVILRRYNIYHKFLNVPSEFAMKHLNKVTEYIKLHVSDGREWTVRFIGRDGVVALGKGWKEFTRENNLKEGDVCVFELVKSNRVLKVSIFPAVENDGSI